MPRSYSDGNTIRVLFLCLDLTALVAGGGMRERVYTERFWGHSDAFQSVVGRSCTTVTFSLYFHMILGESWGGCEW